MEKQICAIIPYDELFQLTQQCKDENYRNIEVIKGNLEDAIPMAIQAEKNGAEVLISRGGTASIIKKYVTIPVVEIKVTQLDLLRILYPYANSDETLLIVGYENVIYGCRTISKLLNIKIEEVIISKEDEEYNWMNVQQKVEEVIYKYKIETIVGDTVPVTRLGKLCRNTHLITSGLEEVFNAMEEALNIIEVKHQTIENQKKLLEPKIQVTEKKNKESLDASGFITRYNFTDIFTKNIRMQKLIRMAQEYAKTDASILIQGESGTGKEVVAQSIHAGSSRANASFVAINCSALSPQLIESELFGYVEGAFTGASKFGKKGLFELAHNGTIFLDEIGDMDKALQTRLLRVLEEKQVMRIGSDKIISINTRIIAATNVDLKEEVRKGNFRSDLYYRLNVLNLNLIPLRERKEDIIYLSNHFIETSNKKYGMQVGKLTEEVIEVLTNYSWPGNIREIKNVAERIVIFTKKGCVKLNDIDLIVSELKENGIHTYDGQEEFINGTLDEIKNKVVNKVFAEEGFNKSKTAKRLGIDRSTLNRFLECSKNQQLLL